MFYRNQNLQDLVVKDGKLYILPKEFNQNSDSEIKDGKYSFWFDYPYLLHPIDTQAIVEGDFIPELSGTMKYSYSEIDYSEYGKTKYYGTVTEYVTSCPIEVKKIWVSYHYYDEDTFDKNSYVKCPITGRKFYDGEEVDWDDTDFPVDYYGICKEANLIIPIHTFDYVDGSDGTEFMSLQLKAKMGD